MSKLLENLLDEPERGKLVYLSVDLIEPHPDNPRKNLGDLAELSDSIKQNGILQNLTVVPQEGGGYRALIGHRRLAAAKMAGLTEVPCVIVEMSQKEQLGVMFAENVQRADLTPYEQAECLQMMIDLGETAASVARQTGLSEATVSRRLRLLKLDKKKFDQAQNRLCKVECIGGEELGNCPERRFGRCRSIARLESCQINAITDYFLANGVIVPPCKVGNYIYYPWHYDDNSGVAILEVDKIVIKDETLVFILDPESDMPMPCWFSMDDFGKTVFLTKEEAIAALKAKGGEAE